MTKPIDGEKLMMWARENLIPPAEEALRKAVQSGALDIEPEPMPDLKPGDRVRHKDMPYLGTGVVREIAKSGIRALVDWGDDWDRKKLHWAPLPAYYRLDKLEKVEDADE